MDRTITRIAVWFVIFIILLTLGFEMISAPNTIENVIGFSMIMVIVYLSIKTRCLATIKLRRKYEK